MCEVLEGVAKGSEDTREGPWPLQKQIFVDLVVMHENVGEQDVCMCIESLADPTSGSRGLRMCVGGLQELR